MFWITVIGFAFLISVILFFKRNTCDIKFGCLSTVQLLYLLFISPVVFVAVINLVVEVIKRPNILILPFNDVLFLSLFLFFLIIAITGNGIHSASASVSDIFPEEADDAAFIMNERLHGPFSHYMIYIGGVLSAIFLVALEINHPIPYLEINIYLLIVLGIIIGFCQAMSIIWSGFIKYNLISILIALLTIIFFSVLVKYTFQFYPLMTIFLCALSTSTLILGIRYLFSSNKKNNLSR